MKLIEIKKYDVIVVGGGAAGLMAAGTAAESGAKVLLLEKMKRPGRKLRITGKGRCNLTNIAEVSEFISHIGPDGRFLRQAFSRFFSEDLIGFFNTIGIKTVIERGGRVFPASEKAQDIVDCLVNWVEKSGVIIKCSSSVKNLKIEHNSIKGVELSNGKIFNADSVIIATGGASYPATGSTGDGYRLAKTADHTIIPIRPALVPLETSGNIADKLEGLNLKNISVSVWKDRKKIAERFGEMVFMQYGISGPVILSLSRQLGKIFENGQRLIFSIDLKPALDYKKLDKRLIRDINDFGNLKFREILRKWLPQKMVPVFIDLLKIPSEKFCHQLNSKERKKILLLLKEFKLEVTGISGFDEAIITAGGVNLKEIDPKTMKSKLVKNLYFAGEVLDLDADTGGYNLQIAFSTGWLAGKLVSC